jgi:hypothetical protein
MDFGDRMGLNNGSRVKSGNRVLKGIQVLEPRRPRRDDSLVDVPGCSVS